MSDTRHSWPVAGTGVRGHAVLRERIEDFKVFEILTPDAEAEGEGAHVWFRIRKQGLSTPAVARCIGEVLGIGPGDVGYAGMKDERSVSEQWFSVPAARFVPASLQAIEGVTCLDVVVQGKKLRRGAHLGNRFEILLREVEHPRVLPEQCRFPNYFGGRRFGVDNLEQAIGWLANRRRRRITPFKKGIFLSVLRAYLFNAVLGARVAGGQWDVMLEGDVPDPEGNPTGPMWGRGTSETKDVARQIEVVALAEHAQLCEQLEYAGVDQGRRSLVGIAREVTCHQVAADQVRLAFFLPTGAYATVLLDQYFQLVDRAVS